MTRPHLSALMVLSLILAACGSGGGTAADPVVTPSTAPTVLSVNPANGVKGVASGAKIVVTFSRPMDQLATQAAYQSGSLPASGMTFDWDSAGTVLTITPNAPLDYASGTSTSVVAKGYGFKLTSVARDRAGNALTPLNVGFTTLRDITVTLNSQEHLEGTVTLKGTTPGLRPAGGYLFVGDAIDGTGYTSLLSFDLSRLSAGLPASNLQRAALQLYKAALQGNPYLYLNPPCNGTDQCDEYAAVRLDHVYYGETLEGNDVNSVTLGALGDIDTYSAGIKVFSRANALAAVRDDLANLALRGNRSQYRLSFPVLTNGDGKNDIAIFASDATADSDAQRPALILGYLIP